MLLSDRLAFLFGLDQSTQALLECIVVLRRLKSSDKVSISCSASLILLRFQLEILGLFSLTRDFANLVLKIHGAYGNSVASRTNEHRVLALLHVDLRNSDAAGVFERL
jgi:hypothetical protein